MDHGEGTRRGFECEETVSRIFLIFYFTNFDFLSPPPVPGVILYKT